MLAKIRIADLPEFDASRYLEGDEAAAERFFGHAPEPLFEQVIARVPLPPRPARRRPHPPKPPYLMPVAA